MEHEIEEVPYDERRLRDADPDGLYLFMLEPYPYMMQPGKPRETPGSLTQNPANRRCADELNDGADPVFSGSARYRQVKWKSRSS